MFVYLMEDGSDSYKIGYTKNIQDRVNQLLIGNPRIQVKKEFKTKYPLLLETALHRHFSYCHDNGEWFLLSSEEVNKFLDICQQLEKNFELLSQSGNPFFKK